MAKIQDDLFLHSDLMLYAEPELYKAEEQSETEKLNNNNALRFTEIELNIKHSSRKASETEAFSELNEKSRSPVLHQTQAAESSVTVSQNWTYGYRRCGRLSEY